jgi:hypothetical protein
MTVCFHQLKLLQLPLDAKSVVVRGANSTMPKHDKPVYGYFELRLSVSRMFFTTARKEPSRCNRESGTHLSRACKEE